MHGEYIGNGILTETRRPGKDGSMLSLVEKNLLEENINSRQNALMPSTMYTELCAFAND